MAVFFSVYENKKSWCSVLSFKNWCLIICFKFCCFLCRLAIIHRYKLWPSCGQPSTTIIHRKTSSIHFNQKVRLYGIGIGIVIGTTNGDIPGLASDPNFAKSWINMNVLPFYLASNIILITVGNEVMTSNDQNLMNKLLPAMQNVQNAPQFIRWECLSSPSHLLLEALIQVMGIWWRACWSLIVRMVCLSQSIPFFLIKSRIDI